MNINLLSNNTTFGVAYTSPPETFTTGKPVTLKKLYPKIPLTSFFVPEKDAYFVNAVNSDFNPIRNTWGFGRLITYATVPSLSHLNPKIQFIPVEVFDSCERIPIKELAKRNIAILASEGEYTRLGDVGAENRRQSFYHNKTPVCHKFWDDRIDDCVKFGFFFKPADMEPIDIREDDAVNNISFRNTSRSTSNTLMALT